MSDTVQAKEFIINPKTNRHVYVGSKVYKKLVREGIIENKGFHRTPENKVVKVINANNEEELKQALNNEKLNSKAREIAQKILEKHLDFLQNECKTEEDVIKNTREIMENEGYLNGYDTCTEFEFNE